MKMKQKLILWIVLPIVLTLSLGLGMLVTRVRSSMYEEVQRNLQSLSGKYVNEIKRDLRHLSVSARELGYSMMALRKTGATRQQYDDILKKVVDEDSFLFAIYTIWEPDALDGKDDEFKGAPGHNQDGRYAPWVARGVDGAAAVQACTAEGGYLKEGGFYLGTKDLKKPRMIPPATWTFQGKKVTIVDYIYPLIDDGEFLGVISTEFELAGVRELIAEIHPFETGYAAILSGNGVYLATEDREKLGKVDERTDIREAISTLSNGKSFSMTRKNAEGVEMLHQFDPIDVGITGCDWILETVVPLDKAMASIHRITFFIGIFAIAGVLLILCIVWFIARKISTPLVQVVKIAQEAEKGDITATKSDFNVTSKDEIGQLVDSMSLMMAAQREAIIKVLVCANSTNAGTENLAALAEESNASMEEITEAIREIAQLSTENSETLEQLNITIEELSSTTDATAKATVKGAETTESVEHASEKVRETVENTTKKMEILEGLTEENKQKADVLSSSVEQISHFITTITAIADQTNLLALNAAIEAARAGDAGRGFAVVADEVRKLAEQSNDAALNIADLIKNLRKDAQASKDTALESESMIEKTLQETHTVEQEISNMVDSIKLVSKEIQNIAAAAQQQAAAAHEMSESASSVAKKSLSVSEQVNVTTSTLDQTAQVSNTVAEEAEKLARIAEELHLSVDFFKVEKNGIALK